MPDLLDRVIGQFDTLIPFLGLAGEDVFDLIKQQKGIWFPTEREEGLPESYGVYRTQIAHSAFLLGYSYFEAFLADLVREIYVSNPKMLPKEKELKYAEILKTTNYEAILELMIEREIIDLFYKRIGEVVTYFEEKLKLLWPEDVKAEIVMISSLRNCIIHNLARADHRLAQVSHYSVGDKIELTSDNVHSFGVKARGLARNLYEQAAERYFKTP